MKKIDVIITYFELDAVKDALCKLGIQGMTVTDIKVTRETFNMPAHSIDLIPRVKIEIIAAENIVEKIIETITNNIQTKLIENVNIFVINIEDVVRIRTGQRGEDAII